MALFMHAQHLEHLELHHLNETRPLLMLLIVTDSVSYTSYCDILKYSEKEYKFMHFL